MKLHESLGFNLGVTNKELKHCLMKVLKEYELTTAQWVVMKLLCEKGEMVQTEIAKNLNSDKMTVGSIVEKLLSKNLIEREKDKTDKRSYCIVISNQGKKEVLDIEKHAEQINKQALMGFTDEEARLLMSYLDRIKQNLKG